jgi:hypothetical protein
LPRDKKDDIITAINNISDESKREAFWSNKPVIEFVDSNDNVVRYQFNGKKYEKVSS